MLASDGFSGMTGGLSNDKIEELLASQQNEPTDRKAERLIRQAIESDGNDNATLVMLEIGN